MNAARVVLAAAILLMGVWANLNSDVIDGWVDGGIAVQSDEPASLVGLQEEEEWLIVRAILTEQGQFNAWRGRFCSKLHPTDEWIRFFTRNHRGP